MNWDKVQNIFIATFLILNIVLWCYNRTEAVTDDISKDQKQRIIKILNDNNIIVEDKCFPSIRTMQKLKVEPYKINEKKLVNNIFGITNIPFRVIDEGSQFSKDGKTINIYNQGINNGLIKYKNNSPCEFIIDFDIKKAIDTAEKFIDTIGVNEDAKWKLSYYTVLNEEDPTYSINYYQVYNNYPIFNSYIELQITNKGVIYAEIKRLTPKKINGIKNNLGTIDYVLCLLLDEIKTNSNDNNNSIYNISSIELGYDKKNNEIKKNSSDILPYYKILLKVNGEYKEYYINALTVNKIEKP